MDKVNRQYGPPLKIEEWKILKSYFKRRIHHEWYRDKKHKMHGWETNRRQMVGMLEYELSIVETEIKRLESDTTG